MVHGTVFLPFLITMMNFASAGHAPLVRDISGHILEYHMCIAIPGVGRQQWVFLHVFEYMIVRLLVSL